MINSFVLHIYVWRLGVSGGSILDWVVWRLIRIRGLLLLGFLERSEQIYAAFGRHVEQRVLLLLRRLPNGLR